MVEVSRTGAVSTLKPYATRFAKAYLAVALVATAVWLVLYAWLLPGLLFNLAIGPFAVGTILYTVVTGATVAVSSVVIFAGGVAYEQYR